MNEKRDELLERYAEAVAHDTRGPSAGVREAVRAHAHMLAAAAAAPVADIKPHQQAANQSHWTVSMVASLAVVGLAGLLYLQIDRGPPQDRETALGVPARNDAPSPRAAAPVTAQAPTPALSPQTAAAEAQAPSARAKGEEERTSPEVKTIASTAGVTAQPSAAAKGPAPGASPREMLALRKEATGTAAGTAVAVAPRPDPAPGAANEVAAKAAAAPPAEMEAATRSHYNQSADRLASAETSAAAKRDTRADGLTRAAPVPAQAPQTAPAPAVAAAPIAAPAPTAPAAVAAPPPAAAVPAVPQRARSVQANPMAERFLDAVRNGQLNAMEGLLAQGVDINTQDDQGNPALLVAVKHRQVSAVRKLLELGADRTLTNREGLTALELARRLGLADIVRVLQAPR